MKFATTKESMEIVKSFGFDIRDECINIDGSWIYKKLDIPRTSFGQAEFSRLAIGNIKPFNQALLWITEWGIWPNESDPILIDRFRISYGDSRSLAEAPGFQFECSEEEEAIALVRITAMFGWDGYLVSDLGNSIFIIRGHEEYAEYYCKP